ncbi:HIRAN domain-containing protein [Rhodanobacter umsongensis]
MQRRHFLIHLSRALAACSALPGAAHAALRPGRSTRLHLQDCRIAGSQYYDCLAVLPDLRPGDRLQLRRQPDNPHDPRAVEVLWHDRKLGYLPRLDNAAAASLLDRAHDLRGEILAIDDPKEEWEPVRLRVWAHDQSSKA